MGNDCFSLVAIGASAGGLRALELFFESVPHDCGMCFFVLQHLSPDHKSILPELLAPHAKLPICEAQDGTALEPNKIFLSPPGVVPVADGRYIRLKRKDTAEALVLPIDIFFKSVATEFGSSAIGVILSGTGSDGTIGAKAIERCGGRIFIQSPEDCDFAGMPRSVLSSGVKYIDAPASDLWRLISEEPEEAVASCSTVKIARKMAALGQEASEHCPEEFDRLFSFLDEKFNLDFGDYHFSSVGRRVRRRMHMLDIETVAEYLIYLRQNEAEANAIYQDLLIGVTQFFRDGGAFEALGDALEDALKKCVRADFRIWVAACATGEEAYSIYMLADEAKQRSGYDGRIIIFATDVFAPAIEAAGLGCYDVKKMDRVSEARRKKYFLEVANSLFKIRPEVRERIVFAQHNFLTDAPFIRMDLVSCRNALIYLRAEAQECALKVFSYALIEDGILFLGASEGIRKPTHSLAAVDSTHRIFRKRSLASDVGRWSGGPAAGGLKRIRALPALLHGQSVTIARDLLSAYDDLLGRFAPDGFLINRDKEVLHYFGSASDFCLPLEGRTGGDLPSRLDQDLGRAVTALMHRAIHDSAQFTAKRVRCRKLGHHGFVDVKVGPLNDSRDDARMFLIELTGFQPATSGDVEGLTDSKAEDTSLLEVDGYVKTLEDELRETRENLESANEALHVFNEELQSINEEMQVSNEELQSTNEELHSMNEELITLNMEYERKNQELIELNMSHDHLLESTEDGLLFVDKRMRVKRFNRAIASAFHLEPSDAGRFIGEIGYKLGDRDEMLRDVEAVLNGRKRVERESLVINGRRFIKRVVPFRGSGGTVEGALLTYTDITTLHVLQRRFTYAIESAGMSWWEWDLCSGALEVHSAGGCLLGEGRWSAARDRSGWMALVHPDDRLEVEQTLEAHLAGESQEWVCEHRFKTSLGEWLWVRNRGIVTDRSTDQKALEMMGTTQDIDAYKRANEALLAAKLRSEEANRAKSEFLAVMSHELRTPLNPILGFSEVLLADTEDEEHREILKTIVESGEHLISLIDEVLDYSKIEAGGVKIDPVEFSLEELLREKLKLMRGQIRGPNVSLASEIQAGPFEKGLPVFFGDVLILEHILRNLIGNAIKFTEHGSITLRVIIDSALEGVAQVVFEVEDTGIGIEASEHKRIFEAFSQGDSSNTRKYGGTGLGLAICKRLTDLLQGTISLESVPGRGSIFRVSTPLRYLAEAALNRTETPASPVVQSSTDTTFLPVAGEPEVLVVEDNESNTHFMTSLLERIGFKVEQVTCGEEALQVTARRSLPFFAILLDLHMPGIGGLATLKELRAREAAAGVSPVPVFILTADVQEQTRAACLAAGADAFVTKPVSIEELRAHLDRVLSDSINDSGGTDR